LEGTATRLAALRVTPSALAKLEDLAGAMETALKAENVDEFGELNFRFHGLIHHMTENVLLTDLLENLYATLRAYRNTRNLQRLNREQVSREHRAIVAALAGGDGDVAELIARRHVERALPIWVDL
jgi:DNA-binding GntR family transcriptional regulator